MKRAKAATSLGNCNKRRTDLRAEFDATSEAMQMVTNSASGRELEHRLNSLQTSLTTIKWAITKYKNILEDCRMQQASQPVDPTAGSHSPRSEASTVSGEMAELSLTSPSQPGPGEDETQQ